MGVDLSLTPSLAVTPDYEECERGWDIGWLRSPREGTSADRTAPVSFPSFGVAGSCTPVPSWHAWQPVNRLFIASVLGNKAERRLLVVFLGEKDMSDV